MAGLLSPIPSLDLRRLRVNKTLHGRSVYRPDDVPGHNVIHGYLHPGTGDALDLFCPAGTPVRAMHDGRVSRIVDRTGKLGCVYLVSTRWLTVYAHLHVREELRVGDLLDAGTLIGWVGRLVNDPHLHLEVWQRDDRWHAISAPTPAQLRQKIIGLVDA
jgi:murein DD-endopeptidase MepM/ murein hydrolase activator NlpD